MHGSDPIAGYAAEAAELVPLFEAISYSEVFAPVADLLPAEPRDMLDIGAGTGRSAAWFAGQGHKVVAVEPVAEFVKAGRLLHPSQAISWIAERLPVLHRVRRMGKSFDLVTLVSVWQHLPPEQRAAAMATIALLVGPGGRLILSLRHGPGSPLRPCFPCDPHETIEAAQAGGLSLVARRPAESVQQKNRDAGVTWTWLAFNRGGDRGQSSIH